MNRAAIQIPIRTANGAYDVTIERGALNRLGGRVREAFPGARAAIVTDTTVDALYGASLQSELERAGIDVCRTAFPAGEAAKTLGTVAAVLDFLAENRLSRSDLAIAFGGGVPGDLAGFAAAVYLRGIRFLQLPTTILAAVDSSVGGKTGVDLPQGKNLVGAFWQPAAVCCDPDLFETLPKERIADGFAEMIKHGFIADAAYLDRLESSGAPAAIETLIARSIEIKAAFVAADTRDQGVRQTLNFGHTFGHAIEVRSGFAVSHGAAVAIGMMMASRAADRLGISEESITERLRRLLVRYELPTETDFGAADLAEAALIDKKRAGGTIQFVFPIRTGAARLVPVPVSELPRIFELGQP